MDTEFGQTDGSTRSLTGFKFVPFNNDGAHCTPGKCQWVSNAVFCLNLSSDSELVRFSLTAPLCFLICLLLFVSVVNLHDEFRVQLFTTIH